ncbi:MAG: cell division protein FtsQ/DivIB [Lachnospiraceae bacterium]
MSKRQDNVVQVQFKRERKGIYIGIIGLVLVVFIVILLTCFKINDIEVTGNVHYSEEQIKDFVLSEGYIDNTVLLMLKNKVKPIEDIPFIAKIDIEYEGPHKILVTVYEKAMAGCIEYMDQYVYFDQDGYVLEISLTKLDDTPCITGIFFDSMELHEKLPIEDKARFKTILTLTQLIQKYDVKVDSIRFTSEGEVVLKYEDIRIELGDGSKIEEQLIDLNRMLEPLKGKKGTLDLKDFDTATGTASFRVDTEKNSDSTQDDADSLQEQSSEEGNNPEEGSVTEDNTVENTQQTLDNEVQN